jgi:hypothetical protein
MHKNRIGQLVKEKRKKRELRKVVFHAHPLSHFFSGLNAL